VIEKIIVSDHNYIQVGVKIKKVVWSGEIVGRGERGAGSEERGPENYYLE